MKRNKTAFEKFFSLSRYRRRYGADHASSKISLDFKSQKTKFLDGAKLVYTHGSSNDISKHFKNLEKEFIGNYELCLTLAKIIVLIRREYKVKKYFQIFESLWNQESEFLLKHLNSRWLISSVDTFFDHSQDKNIIYLSLACNVLANSIKIYESERFLIDAHLNKDNLNKQNDLDSEVRFSLFDGMSVFKYGTDDTLRNMRWRINKVYKDNIAGEIFLELFKRFNHFDTAYKRAKDRHNRNRTAWWE